MVASGVTPLGQHPERTVGQHRQVDEEEEVHRSRHQGAGFLRPAQVDQRDHGQQEQRQLDAIPPQRGEGRGDGLHPGREADRGGEHVVHQQRGGRQQAGQHPQVFPGHHVGAAARRIAVDRLVVRQRHDGKQRRDHQADGQRPGQADAAGQDQGQVDLLVGIGDGGEGVGEKAARARTLFRRSPASWRVGSGGPIRKCLSDSIMTTSGQVTGMDRRLWDQPGFPEAEVPLLCHDDLQRVDLDGRVRLDREPGGRSLRRVIGDRIQARPADRQQDRSQRKVLAPLLPVDIAAGDQPICISKAEPSPCFTAAYMSSTTTSNCFLISCVQTRTTRHPISCSAEKLRRSRSIVSPIFFCQNGVSFCSQALEIVAMPEVAINENTDLGTREHDVRTTRQLLHMLAEPQTSSMQS